MKKIRFVCLVAFYLTLFSSLSFGQTCIDVASSTTINEDFDSLANSGTDHTTVPNGWAFVDNNSVYNVSTGSSTTGDTYSFGTNMSTERSFGSLATGTTGTIIKGGCITNTSGNNFISITISYTGEQWRQGNTPGDILNFEYSTDANSIDDNTATWIPVATLNFNSPQNGGTVGALDGNNSSNQEDLISSISVTIPDSISFYFRWLDADSSGTDHGMAIDDFSITTADSASSASGTVAGRVRDFKGNGLKFVTVMITGGGLDEPLYATTNQFGKYLFEDIPVGSDYVLQVFSRRHTFEEQSRIISLKDFIEDADFIGRERF